MIETILFLKKNAILNQSQERYEVTSMSYRYIGLFPVESHTYCYTGKY